MSFEGALEPRLKRVLDALRLTVLGLLLTVGLTVGLGIGFGVGGCTGAVAGTLGGLLIPFALACAFRNQRTRNWLVHLANCVLAPDNKDHKSRPRPAPSIGSRAMPKDRRRRRFVAPYAQIVVERSSAHPVRYAIVLLVERNGMWHTVRTFDNAHAPEEHHEHRYVGSEKQPPIISYGAVNDGMQAEVKVLEGWFDIVHEWEGTR